MIDEVFECLRAAVTLAKEHQIKTGDGLRFRLKSVGYDETTIEEALKLWANYENRKSK